MVRILAGQTQASERLAGQKLANSQLPAHMQKSPTKNHHPESAPGSLLQTLLLPRHGALGQQGRARVPLPLSYLVQSSDHS